MNLSLDDSVCSLYRSHSQIARVMTENWVLENMFCPRCGNSHLKHFKNNQAVADFFCEKCGSEFELKSSRKVIGTTILGGAYGVMVDRITSNNNPDFFLMRYSFDHKKVIDFIIIPKFFFTPDIVKPRKPLPEYAKRSGWVGCDISLKEIPEQCKVHVVKNGVVMAKNDVLKSLATIKKIAVDDTESRGWLLDVLRYVNLMPNKFTLSDIYKFEKELSEKHPNNNHVRDKIRQELQFLRDKQFIKFLGDGKYEKTI